MDKTAAVRRMSTEALQRISDHPSSQEAADAHSALDRVKYPLAGLVHISGVGQVPLTAIRDELATRQQN